MKSSTISWVIALFILVMLAGCVQKEKGSETEQQEEQIVDSGILFVDSSPSSAQVYVNGELKGDTPLSLYNLPVGFYNVAVKKDGYRDFEKTIAVKVGRTEEIDAELSPLSPLKNVVEEKMPIEDAEPKNIPPQSPAFNKVNLSSFAMYYDFEKNQFTDIRTDKSDLFSRKYYTYVHFAALTPAKMNILNKPVKDVQKEDCIFSDVGVATLFSGQTLCVKTVEGSIVTIGGTWQSQPSELEWVLFS